MKSEGGVRILDRGQMRIGYGERNDVPREISVPGPYTLVTIAMREFASKLRVVSI